MRTTIAVDRVTPTFKVRGVCWDDGLAIGHEAPPTESVAMDITDAAVRRLTVAASLFAAAFAGAALTLAYAQT